ncbi:MAG: hypothetical protein V5A62_18205 [Haloarculaceae archaeon]
MRILERPTFESEEARAIYRHVEGNGTVAVDEVMLTYVFEESE